MLSKKDLFPKKFNFSREEELEVLAGKQQEEKEMAELVERLEREEEEHQASSEDD